MKVPRFLQRGAVGRKPRYGIELLSDRFRRALREQLVGMPGYGWSVEGLRDLFQAEGLWFPRHDPIEWRLSRSEVEEIYRRIDWTDWDQVGRVLRIAEVVLAWMHDTNKPDRDTMEMLLRRDGLVVDELGSIQLEWDVLTEQSILDLPDASAIPGHLRRMWDSVDERPEQAISAAKDAIESAGKHVLLTLGVSTTSKERFPALIDLAHRSLKLHPTSIAPNAKGAELLVAMLGSITTMVNKIDELRNLYGDGHGRPTTVAGLTRSHSRFVARCTAGYVAMVLDMLDAHRTQQPERSGSGEVK